MECSPHDPRAIICLVHTEILSPRHTVNTHYLLSTWTARVAADLELADRRCLGLGVGLGVEVSWWRHWPEGGRSQIQGRWGSGVRKCGKGQPRLEGLLEVVTGS